MGALLELSRIRSGCDQGPWVSGNAHRCRLSCLGSAEFARLLNISLSCCQVIGVAVVKFAFFIQRWRLPLNLHKQENDVHFFFLKNEVDFPLKATQFLIL